jgi:hypothetical protein
MVSHGIQVVRPAAWGLRTTGLLIRTRRIDAGASIACSLHFFSDPTVQFHDFLSLPFEGRWIAIEIWKPSAGADVDVTFALAHGVRSLGGVNRGKSGRAAIAPRDYSSYPRGGL